MINSLIVLLLAYCSIVYNMILSQSISLIRDNTVDNYTLSIGIFLAFIGFGSFFYNYKIKDQARSLYINRLIKVEFLISILGFLCPVILIIVNNYFYNERMLMSCLHISYTAILGILTGMEIPLMAKLDEKLTFNYVLAIDLVGSFFGYVIFGLILINYLNLIEITYMTVMINGVISLYLSFKHSLQRRYAVPLILILISLYFYLDNLLNLLKGMF